MKNWSRLHTLIAGLALIVLTNAVALVGVAWNRSGEPESTLKLTQRELTRPYYFEMNRENSGISLHLDWRVPASGENRYYSYSGSTPDWLDQAKMASLGFDVNLPAGKQVDYRWTQRQLSREVLLVLEMDGPAYQKSLQLARRNAAEQAAALKVLPHDKTRQDNAKRAHNELAQEEQENSRLFAVDAGLNRAELRARYPDRTRYAIVRAQVRPSTRSEHGRILIAGYIDGISDNEINVPHRYHALFEGGATGQSGGMKTFEAMVAFGQRLEPWLLGLSAGKNGEAGGESVDHMPAQ
jgi:hypothetical protein